MNKFRTKKKSSVVYIGLTTIVILHAVLAVFLDKAVMAMTTVIILKIFLLLSLVFSMIIFREFVFPFFCRKIDKKYIDE